MDISVCMDKLKVILNELRDYSGKDQHYSFFIGKEYLDSDPSFIYQAVRRYVLWAYEELFDIIKEKYIGKEESSE